MDIIHTTKKRLAPSLTVSLNKNGVIKETYIKKEAVGKTTLYKCVLW